MNDLRQHLAWKLLLTEYNLYDKFVSARPNFTVIIIVLNPLLADLDCFEEFQFSRSVGTQCD